MNIKVTTKEIGHIIDKFQKTFETYGEDDSNSNFVEKAQISTSFSTAFERQSSSLKMQNPNYLFFELKPYS